MNWRSSAFRSLTGASALAFGALALSALAQPGSVAPRYQAGAEEFRAEPLTPFEKNLLTRARASGAVHENETPPPADNNARGLRLESGKAAIVNLAVRERKYGISLDGTGDVLIKNFTFIDRRSKDAYGSGLIVGQKEAAKGETWLSNAWIDLRETGPNPDYKLANNEAISVERGNRPVNVRRAVLIGAEESGLDNKGDVRMDASFIASGHRPVRIWNGASLVLVNSTVLAFPEFAGFWFGGGEGIARLDYYNCRFGRVGDRPEDLSDHIPDWMIAHDEDDPVQIKIQRLTKDPLNRDPGGFWVPAGTPAPSGYLARGR
jgi:hypothetical protein